MNFKLRLTDTAAADLRRAFDYLLQFNPGSASAMAIRVEDAFERLRQFLESGCMGRHPGTRELVIVRTPHIGPYRLDGSTITILALIHGRQKWPSSLDRT